MRRFLAAFFVVIAALLLVVFLTRKTADSSGGGPAEDVAQTQDARAQGSSDQDNALGLEDSGVVSFMPLKPDESLLSSMGIDLDGDNLDDEILVVSPLKNISAVKLPV